MNEQLALDGIGRSVDPEAEFYPTPPALCCALMIRLAAMGICRRGPVLEPSAGDGAFVRALREVWGPNPEITAVDIRDTKADCLLAGANRFIQGDWPMLAPDLGKESGAATITGNPPFSPAAEHVAAGYDNFVDGTVIAFLLRLGFLASAERKAFWKTYPPFAMASIIERPSFEKGKTDLHDYGFFIWQVGYRGKAELLPGISWR